VGLLANEHAVLAPASLHQSSDACQLGRSFPVGHVKLAKDVARRFTVASVIMSRSEIDVEYGNAAKHPD